MPYKSVLKLIETHTERYAEATGRSTLKGEIKSHLGKNKSISSLFLLYLSSLEFKFVSK